MSTLFIGFVIGALARFLMPGRYPAGIIVTILLGVAGSALALYAGRQFGWYADNSAPGILASVVAAMVFLLGYRLIFRKRVAAAR